MASRCSRSTLHRYATCAARARAYYTPPSSPTITADHRHHHIGIRFWATAMERYPSGRRFLMYAAVALMLITSWMTTATTAGKSTHATRTVPPSSPAPPLIRPLPPPPPPVIDRVTQAGGGRYIICTATNGDVIPRVHPRYRISTTPPWLLPPLFTPYPLPRVTR